MKEKLKQLQEATKMTQKGHWKLQWLTYSNHWILSLLAHPHKSFDGEDPELLIAEAIKWMAGIKQPESHKTFFAYEDLSKESEK